MNGAIENIDELADEYVLGLLDEGDHARVEARIDTDSVLRAAVAASRDRFLALDLLENPATRPDGLWDRIAAGLDGARAQQDPARQSKVVANDNRQHGWRLTAFAGLAASILLAIGLGFSLIVRPEPQVVAVLMNAEGEPLVLVEDYGNDSARITPLAAFDVPEGRVMQVWTLPSKDMGPVSLGLLPRSETMTLDGPDLPQPQEAQLYEITIEQAGGSPTGRPTGPILVKGFARHPR